MFSLFIAKISAFLTQLIVIRLLPKEEFGTIAYFLSFLVFFLPFSGFGTYQGLVKFGSNSDDYGYKKRLFQYSFFKGAIAQIFITILFILTLTVFSSDNKSVFLIVFFISLRFIGYFIINLISGYYRIINDNKTFAILNIWINLASFIFTIILSYFYSGLGFLIALGISPFIILLFIKKDFFSSLKMEFKIDLKNYWKFNFNASLAYFLGDLIFFLDVFLLEKYLGTNAVAEYKVLVLIPFNLMLFPQIFLQTDFPKLCFYFKDKTYIFNYIKNYLRIFIPFSLVTIIFFYFTKDFLIPFIFGEQYNDGGNDFLILISVILIAICTRTLFANLISAIGKEELNTFINFILVLNLGLFSLYFIPKYGVSGMIYAISCSLLVASFLNVVSFFYFYEKIINLNKKL